MGDHVRTTCTATGSRRLDSHAAAGVETSTVSVISPPAGQDSTILASAIDSGVTVERVTEEVNEVLTANSVENIAADAITGFTPGTSAVATGGGGGDGTEEDDASDAKKMTAKVALPILAITTLLF